MIAKSTLAKIHIAKQQLGMDDDTYRAMLRSVGGVQSSKELTPAGASRVLKHLEQSGFKPVGRKPTMHAAADDAQSRKIRALWIDLHARGEVRDSSENALASYVHRQTGVSALKWLSAAQASLVIESLKKWIERLPEEAS
ncbi:regulatory protein GemA [Burkholderia cenocepacia]|uniref:gp16 family protein n=1 Tax=Burkholderia cenocepacia TaxID=95486 RepID=UPI001AA1CDF8|nr:regulatory protein GemA [Burkholderia cenocepacia]MBO1856821.1 regulatory protein GemA [Burkholderia cenocepacia]